MVASINDIINIRLNTNHFSGMDSLVTISERLVERMQEERPDQAVDFSDRRYHRARREVVKLSAFKEKVANNIAVTTKAKSAAGFVEKYLDDMKTDLELLLGSTDDAARATAAADFNEYLDKINSKVDGANQIIDYKNVNLIGNTLGPDWETDTISAKITDGGAYTEIEGGYLGTRFQIQDADGDYWQFHEGDNVYREYSSDGSGETTGVEISADNMTVSSYDSSDESVTLTNGTDTITGTVQRGGLGLLNAEYYNDFADDTSVQEAIDDIEAAIEYFDSTASLITAKTTLLEGNFDLIKKKIANAEEDSANIVNEQITESAAKTRAANLKMTLAINNINMISNANQGLVENMMMMASPIPKAPGVFGMMGL